MTLIKRGRIYHYEFRVHNVIYRKSTGQIHRDDAAEVEAAAQREVRRQAAGLPPLHPVTPSFSAWAETCYAVKRMKLRRPDVYERTLRSVLAFWGARPTGRNPVAGGVYHDLRLSDPITDPTKIQAFEQWMAARGIAGSTRNSYWSCLSGMYRLALRPRYRQQTGVSVNPFLDVDRARPNRRRISLAPEDLRAWVQHAAPHARLAIIIGALAPKLRLDQVLALDFATHFDRDLRYITFSSYKGLDSHGGDPQITAIGDELREVLLELRRARPGVTRLITWRGKPVKAIKRAAQSAAKSAGLPWGVQGGITFHVLRKAFASEAALLGLSEVLVSLTLDHRDPRTTRQHYTHVEAAKQKPVMDQMAAHFALKQSALDAVGILVRGDTTREAKTLAKRRGSKKRGRVTKTHLTR